MRADTRVCSLFACVPVQHAEEEEEEEVWVNPQTGLLNKKKNTHKNGETTTCGKHKKLAY
jgi:hypothetical protein